MMPTCLRSLGTAAVLAAAFATLSVPIDAAASEVCRFTGTTDYDGHVNVVTQASGTGEELRLDVTGTFDSSSMFLFGIHYRLEEISTWRSGNLESVAVNSRYLWGRHIVRQQWDDFQRMPAGLEAFRVQAKTLADFRHKHPGFVAHWDPATFGQPWLRDYPSATPERRSDLDLRAAPLPPGLRSPLAMAFYWIRWMPHGRQQVPVFLPGFKSDRVIDLPVTATQANSDTLWQAPLHYPAFSERPASTANAWTSPDRHLLKLAFEIHMSHGSGAGLITQQGCEGAPVVPAALRQD